MRRLPITIGFSLVTAVALCLVAARVMAQDDSKRMGDDKMHDGKMMMDKDTVMKFKGSLAEKSTMDNVKADLKMGNADLEEMHMMLAREMAAKELMRDPEVAAKIREMASNPDYMKFHENDMKMMQKMMGDMKMQRRLINEMVLRESCKMAMGMDHAGDDHGGMHKSDGKMGK